MSARTRKWRWAGLTLAAAVLTLGCNPITAMYFLLPNPNSGIQPAFPLAPEDKEKNVKVLILASSGLETRPEFLRVDSELSNLLVQKLEKHFKEKEANVSIMPISKLNKFKDEHPNWQALGPLEVGEHFGADYVISLEINEMSLYEPGSRNMLYRGRAAVSVDVIDVHKPDEGPINRQEYNFEYPQARGPIPVEDTTLQQFRLYFFNYVATKLSWHFIAHPVEAEYKLE